MVTPMPLKRQTDQILHFDPMTTPQILPPDPIAPAQTTGTLPGNAFQWITILDMPPPISELNEQNGDDDDPVTQDCAEDKGSHESGDGVAMREPLNRASHAAMQHVSAIGTATMTAAVNMSTSDDTDAAHMAYGDNEDSLEEEEEMGFRDLFDVLDEHGKMPPGAPAGFDIEQHEPPLFVWQNEAEEHQRYILYCHTQKCDDFESGHCLFHKPMLCFDYHFDSQKRRPPIGADGRLHYWDIPCEYITHPTQCPRGGNCLLSHSKDEISYHPAKYKTRMCNGKDCRQAICCFAHFESELRTFAPSMYSQFVLGQNERQGQPALQSPQSDSSVSILQPEMPMMAECCPELAMDEMNQMMKRILTMDRSCELSDESRTSSFRPLSDAFNFDTFKAIPCKNKSHLHDRKLCPYFHNARDRRRVPVNYKSEQCEKSFDQEDSDGAGCEDGEACDKCHNRLELLYHPEVFKQRFCATFPKIKNCPRGSFCAFAHSRDEITGKLFTLVEEQQKTDEFYMYKFKTLWCPYGVQHDWHRCVYAHTYQDCRRSPILGYGSEPCPFWDKNLALSDYEKRCPNGFCCQYAHGSKEQLYHPSYYKTMPCTDWTGSGTCPRAELCAFFHSPLEQRATVGQNKFDYTKPLATAECLHTFQPAFSRPPLFTLDDDDSNPRRKRQIQSGIHVHSLELPGRMSRGAHEFVPNEAYYYAGYDAPWPNPANMLRDMNSMSPMSGMNHMSPINNVTAIQSMEPHSINIDPMIGNMTNMSAMNSNSMNCMRSMNHMPSPTNDSINGSSCGISQNGNSQHLAMNALGNHLAAETQTQLQLQLQVHLQMQRQQQAQQQAQQHHLMLQQAQQSQQHHQQQLGYRLQQHSHQWQHMSGLGPVAQQEGMPTEGVAQSANAASQDPFGSSMGTSVSLFSNAMFWRDSSSNPKGAVNVASPLLSFDVATDQQHHAEHAHDDDAEFYLGEGAEYFVANLTAEDTRGAYSSDDIRTVPKSALAMQNTKRGSDGQKPATSQAAASMWMQMGRG
eukprot:GEMP01001594.1.p1 GENE.GEMP01001594.1~~GEMP01001594.1.p1  ORF type:complete len:1021 (+),score=211.80 GEMP01001594.1:289-3351(+)